MNGTPRQAARSGKQLAESENFHAAQILSAEIFSNIRCNGDLTCRHRQKFSAIESRRDAVHAGREKFFKIFFAEVLTSGGSRCILSKLDSRGSLKTEQCNAKCADERNFDLNK